MQTTKLNRRVRGFTLTESAIVLGIIGLILGAIWVAAASVYQNIRISTASRQMLAIVQAIRSMHSTATVVDTANGTDLTAAFNTGGIFPSDMINAGVVVNPWSGTNQGVQILSAQTNEKGDSFNVAYINLPQSVCVDMLVRNTGSGRDSGLTLAGKLGAEAAPPISVKTATTACDSANASSASFVFKLKG